MCPPPLFLTPPHGGCGGERPPSFPLLALAGDWTRRGAVRCDGDQWDNDSAATLTVHFPSPTLSLGRGPTGLVKTLLWGRGGPVEPPQIWGGGL